MLLEVGGVTCDGGGVFAGVFVVAVPVVEHHVVELEHLLVTYVRLRRLVVVGVEGRP